MQKDQLYWENVSQIANTISLLSIETQKPIVDQYIEENPEYADDLDPETIAALCHEHYSDEDRARWDQVEQDAATLVTDYGIAHEDVVRDIWSAVAAMAMQPTSTSQYH